MAISDGEKEKREVIEREMMERETEAPKIDKSQMSELNTQKSGSKTEAREKGESQEESSESKEKKEEDAIVIKINAAMQEIGLSYEIKEIKVDTFKVKLTEFQNNVLKDTQCLGFAGDGDMAKNWKAMFEEWDQETVVKSHISVRW